MSTVEVPERIEGFSFCLVKAKDKRPFEPNWRNNPYAYDDQKLQKHIQVGGNYGVICGYADLMVLDVDDVTAFTEEVDLAKIPPTFSVKTGGGGLHFYFIVRGGEHKKVVLKGRNGDHLGELQGTGTMVVGPGSIHPNGATYAVQNDADVAEVDHQELMAILKPVLSAREGQEDATNKKKATCAGDPFAEVSILDVINTSAFQKSGNQLFGPHPVHGSDTGHNLVVNPSKNSWWCGHHQTGGGVALWIAVQEGIIRCDDAKPGALRGAKFLRVLEAARSRGLIPDDDRGRGGDGEAWPHFEISDFCYEVTDDNGDPATDGDGNQKYSFSPSLATDSILKKAPLKMMESEAEIYRFDCQIYQPDGARKIDLALCRVARDRVIGKNVQEVIRRIKNELLEDPVEFDANPYLLGVRNGVVDLRTGEFRDYQPDDLITYQIDVNYDPVARCPRFVQFLEEIQPNTTDRLTLVDWFPATAIKKPLPYVLFLLGLGRNGKGIYERLMKRFFGAAAFRDMGLAEVSKNNFAAGTFYKKLGWIATEQSGKKKAAIGTDFIKLVSGAGSIDADRKNQARIQFEAYFQTIVDTNAMPTIEDTSIGWMERFCKQDLPFVFVDEPDPSDPLQKKKDPHLFDKLTTEEELSGILNLLIWRAKEICETETIVKRPAADLFAEYTKQSSSLSAFWDEFCEYDDAAISVKIPTTTIYKAYKRWAGHLVGEVVDEARFGRFLKKKCRDREPSRPRIDGERVTVYPGLLFDEDHVNSVIEGIDSLRTSNGQVRTSNGQEEKGQQIANGQDGQVNLWIQIVEKFGPQENDVNSSYEEEFDKMPVHLVHLGHSTTGGQVPEEVSCPLPGTSMSITCPPKGDYQTIAEELEEDRRRQAEEDERTATPPPKGDGGRDPTSDEAESLEMARAIIADGKRVTFGNVEAYLEKRARGYVEPKVVKRFLNALASQGWTTDKEGALSEGVVG